jgi:integrase
MLTDLKARKIAPDSTPIADGTIPGLRLEPGAARGRGKWTLRFVSPETGKRRDMGLGAYPEVGIVAARARAAEARQAIAGGKDPIAHRDALRAAAAASTEALTFERAARQVHQDRRDGWKNAKHADQWINTLRDYVFPAIGARPVASLSVADFADVLRPIWLEKAETASRVKQRCHAVMKWCMARGLVQGNPLDVVDHLLPPQPGKRERTTHQPSMPWRGIPNFVQLRLRGGATNVTRALLEFVILTAARSGEAREATWDEIDLETMVWTVPAARMKAKTTHRVPLSARAVEILQAQRKSLPDTTLVFPAPRGGVLSDMVLTKFLRDYNAPSSERGRVATAHGFRSSFRDWASESGYPRDLAERAIAHTIANQAEAAYHRTDLLDQRRGMMEAWSRFVVDGAGHTQNSPTSKKKASG